MTNRLRTMLPASGNMLSVVLILPALLNVHNYLDPGTGSLIIQVLIGTFLGGLFLAKLYWKRVSTFLSKLFRKDRRGDD